MAKADGTLKYTGSLAGGFSLDIAHDVDFTDIADAAYIGSVIYVKVEWTAKSPSNNAFFVLSDCAVQQAKIVRQSCYSDTLHVKPRLEIEKMSKMTNG